MRETDAAGAAVAAAGLPVVCSGGQGAQVAAQLSAALEAACEEALAQLAGQPTYAVVSWPLLCEPVGAGAGACCLLARHRVSGSTLAPHTEPPADPDDPQSDLEERIARMAVVRRDGSRAWAETVLRVLVDKLGKGCAIVGMPCDEVELPHTWPGARAGGGASDGGDGGSGLVGEHKEPRIGLLVARLTGGQEEENDAIGRRKPPRVVPFVVEPSERDFLGMAKGDFEHFFTDKPGTCLLFCDSNYAQATLDGLLRELPDQTLLCGGITSCLNAENELGRTLIVNCPNEWHHAQCSGEFMLSNDGMDELEGYSVPLLGYDVPSPIEYPGKPTIEEMEDTSRKRDRYEFDFGGRSLGLYISSRSSSPMSTITCESGIAPAAAAERLRSLDIRLAKARDKAARAARRVSADDEGLERVVFRGGRGAALAFGCVGRRVDQDADALFTHMAQSVGGNVLALHAQGEFAPTLLAMAQTRSELTVRDAQAQSGGGSLTVRDGAVERAGPVEGVRLPDFMPAAVSCAYTCVMQIMS